MKAKKILKNIGSAIFYFASLGFFKAVPSVNMLLQKRESSFTGARVYLLVEKEQATGNSIPVNALCGAALI